MLHQRDRRPGPTVEKFEERVLFAAVSAVRLFYNNSAFDGNRPGTDPADDAAVATDKAALLPGLGRATFANVSTSVNGINGIMVDIRGRDAAASAPLPGDFQFKVGTTGDPASWPALGIAPAVSLRRGAGAGGSDRVTLVFSDRAISNTWLEMTVLPTDRTGAAARTGLTARQVFYFGHVAGDAGDGEGAASAGVDALDLSAVKRGQGTTSAVAGRLDFNRDGRVNALDLAAARSNIGRRLPLRSFGPRLDRISGTARQGQTLTATGEGFTLNEDPAPYLIEDMESGAFNPKWKKTAAGGTHGLAINTTDNRTPFSHYNAHLNFTKDNRDGYFSAPDVAPAWYVEYWFRLSDWDWGTTDYGGSDRFLANFKVMRYWNPSSAVNENFLVSYSGLTDSLLYNEENVSGDSSRGRYVGGIRSEWGQDDWHHLQAEFVENAAQKEASGQFHLWLDGRERAAWDNIVTREDFEQFKRPSVIGFDAVWGPNTGESDQAPNHFFIDDVYLESGGLWHAEIGDASRYTDTRHREAQRITSWTDGQVSFSFNQGSFRAGSTVFLYITDARGNVNEAGYPVLIPAGATAAIPAVAAIPAAPPIPVVAPSDLSPPTASGLLLDRHHGDREGSTSVLSL